MNLSLLQFVHTFYRRAQYKDFKDDCTSIANLPVSLRKLLFMRGDRMAHDHGNRTDPLALSLELVEATATA